jgi:hypothetical protein
MTCSAPIRTIPPCTSRKLTSGPKPFPVAVHTYNLPDDELKSVCRKGVSVYRRLDRTVFVNLLVAWRLSQLPADQVEGFSQRNGQQLSGFLADGG